MVEQIVRYIRYLVERGEAVQLGKKQSAELLAVLDNYERLQERVAELENEVRVAEMDAADAWRHCMNFLDGDDGK